MNMARVFHLFVLITELFFCQKTVDNWFSFLTQISSVQSLSRVRLFATPWTAACQASLSITNCRSLPKPMSIELVMPSNHLILCFPLLLLPSLFPSNRVFSNESALRIRWPKYWSFTISGFSEHSGLISFRTDWFDLLAVILLLSCVCLWPHGLQHTRLLCSLLSPGVCSNSCPLSQWCYLSTCILF